MGDPTPTDDFSHDDQRAVAVPYWVLREAPTFPAAIVYQQFRYWRDAAADGRPRAAGMGWLYDRDGEAWLAIPDHVWAHLGLSPDQLYRARKALADADWIVTKRMKVRGRPIACVQIVPRASAELDSADPRDNPSATARTSDSADVRNAHLPKTGETGETADVAEATPRDLATAVVQRWWEALEPRPPDNYIGLVKIVEGLIKRGWTQRQVYAALVAGECTRTAAGLDAWMRRGGRRAPAPSKADSGYDAIRRARGTEQQELLP